MIEFVRAKKRLLWAFVLLLVWTCGYRYAADKAEAEQTALIATYRHSSMVAAEQYALQLKKAQDERQRWYDFSQKQGRKPVKKQYPPQTKKAGYLKTKAGAEEFFNSGRNRFCINQIVRHQVF
ncbi:protein tyrosine phosphatase [Neisseria meningitidis]|uniref:protein tyrosine phosphatase n=1 Tax=Neisseria meningitidis TaxID=487 RepID=UPI00214B4E67|nr:protein tyrosine phosphatase [Neisseria meningitidis]